METGRQQKLRRQGVVEDPGQVFLAEAVAGGDWRTVAAAQKALMKPVSQVFMALDEMWKKCASLHEFFEQGQEALTQVGGWIRAIDASNLVLAAVEMHEKTLEEDVEAEPTEPAEMLKGVMTRAKRQRLNLPLPKTAEEMGHEAKFDVLRKGKMTEKKEHEAKLDVLRKGKMTEEMEHVGRRCFHSEFAKKWSLPDMKTRGIQLGHAGLLVPSKAELIPHDFEGLSPVEIFGVQCELRKLLEKPYRDLMEFARSPKEEDCCEFRCLETVHSHVMICALQNFYFWGEGEDFFPDRSDQASSYIDP